MFRVLHDTVARDLTSTLWHRVFTRGNLRNQFGSLWPTGENSDIEEKISKVIVVDELFHKKILFSYRCMYVYFYGGLGTKNWRDTGVSYEADICSIQQ